MPHRLVENPGLADIQNPELRDFFELWLGLQQEHDLPRLRDFSMTLFAEHVPLMALNDYDPETGRFFVRLYGSGYVDGTGQDLTRRFVDDIENTEALLERYSWMVKEKQPYLSLDNSLFGSPKAFSSYDVLACPLFDDEGNVTTLMFRIEFTG